MAISAGESRSEIEYAPNVHFGIRKRLSQGANGRGQISEFGLTQQIFTADAFFERYAMLSGCGPRSFPASLRTMDSEGFACNYAGSNIRSALSSCCSSSSVTTPSSVMSSTNSATALMG